MNERSLFFLGYISDSYYQDENFDDSYYYYDDYDPEYDYEYDDDEYYLENEYYPEDPNFVDPHGMHGPAGVVDPNASYLPEQPQSSAVGRRKLPDVSQISESEAYLSDRSGLETDRESQRRRQLPSEPNNAASIRDKVYSNVNQLPVTGHPFRFPATSSADPSRPLVSSEQDPTIPVSNGSLDFSGARGGSIAPVLGDVQENDLIGDATGGDEYYDGDDWYPEGYGPEDYYYHGDGDYSYVDPSSQDPNAYPEDVNNGFILQEPYDHQNLDEFGNPMPIESFNIGDPESANYENVHELSNRAETDMYMNTHHPLPPPETEEYYETATPGYYDEEGNFIPVDEQVRL